MSVLAVAAAVTEAVEAAVQWRQLQKPGRPLDELIQSKFFSVVYKISLMGLLAGLPEDNLRIS